MPRVRLGVALLVPQPLAAEIDGLRRALGAAALERIPPHLTLVPPVNVRHEAVPAALAVLRDAAARSQPLTLRLGPPATFAPTTPTVHLAARNPGNIADADADADADAADADADEGEGELRRLRRLRDDVFRAPLERPLTFPFHPHVTLCDDTSETRLRAALEALGDFVVDVHFDRVHLLEERRDELGARRWDAAADVPLAPRLVVGRGGVELELTTSGLLDPEAARFERDSWPADRPRPVVEADPGDRQAFVVVARRDGEVVGLVHGWTSAEGAEVVSVLVHPEHRRQGVALQLVRAFHSEARRLAEL